ncbi:MAG: DUF2141 domain-containing protein [Deltaproteobacteria bacterium]|nr:DUF2141 domain-containing protein [Deltaproteobacteria bacterium]
MSNGRQITLLKKWRLAALLSAVVTAAIHPVPMASAGTGTIEAHVIKLRNNHGQVICTLFTPSDKFPDQSHEGMTMAVPIKNKQATCYFRNVRYGNYAIVAFHDENHDGEFNQNWLGLPKEGFGFSDNPGTLRKPVFDDAKFIVSQPLMQVTIKLNYWF